MADGLSCIGMENHAMIVRDLSNLFDGSNRTDLVVGGHDRDQNSLVRDGIFNLSRIDKAVLIDRQECHRLTSFLKMFAGIENRFVLGNAGDNVIAFRCVPLSAPRMAILSASVAPLVKIISSG